MTKNSQREKVLLNMVNIFGEVAVKCPFEDGSKSSQWHHPEVSRGIMCLVGLDTTNKSYGKYTWCINQAFTKSMQNATVYNMINRNYEQIFCVRYNWVDVILPNQRKSQRHRSFYILFWTFCYSSIVYNRYYISILCNELAYCHRTVSCF